MGSFRGLSVDRVRRVANSIKRSVERASAALERTGRRAWALATRPDPAQWWTFACLSVAMVVAVVLVALGV
jgi:hypothetical protein